MELLTVWWLAARFVGVLEIPGVSLIATAGIWILAGFVVIRILHAFATIDRRSVDTHAALRLRSLRLAGLSFVFIGMILAVTEETVGRGAIYSWTISAAWLLVIPLGLTLTLWWRRIVRARLEGMRERGRLGEWVVRTRGWPIGFVASAIGGALLLWRDLRRFGLQRLARFELTRRVMAYLARQKVAKQAEAMGSRNFQPLPAASQDALEKAPMVAMETVGAEVLSELREACEGRERSIVALVGEAGLGKSALLERLKGKLEEGREETEAKRVVMVQADYEGFESLRKKLAEALDLGEKAGADALRDAFERRPTVLLIDDLHRLVRPRVGGLGELDRVIELARRAGGTWVMAFEDPGWSFVRRARGEGAVFDAVLRLPRWDEDSLGELVMARSKAAGIEVAFDALDLPSQALDDDDLDELERARTGYFRILWDYVDGNPTLALYWWRESLLRDESQGKNVVQLFQPPRATELESLPPAVYFVLRAVVQLDGAERDDIVASTQLGDEEVSNALRYCRSRQFTELRAGRIYISRLWFRAVTRVLWRRHLLIRSA